MTGEACFREAVRLERGVGRVVVYPIAPIAECVEKAPLCGCIDVSVRNRKSGECWSSIVTTSIKKGLLAPAF